ncbi:hypothetical protein K4F52_006812 [Lecanicillium sp. MT-2017a]|nr:hypothetical protein K4F52_006812 [Lecanicillium sp. MT-2017a]
MAVNTPVEILGQQPSLQVYTQLSSIFDLHSDSQADNIVETLRAGLVGLSKAFPWVAGQVVNEGACPGNSGVFKIKEFEATPRLLVKDMRDDKGTPSMDELRNANYPMTMLDESYLAPRMTLPGSPFEDPLDPRPVLMLQLTFIRGGLILTSATEHHAVDIIGQAQLLSWLSQACHGIPFSDREKEFGNRNRENAIPLLDHSHDIIAQFGPLMIRPPAAPASGGLPPPSVWAFFNIGNDALTKLKAEATKTVTVDFISTDDALSALIWQSVTRARQQRIGPNREVKMTRAIDVRKHCNLPKEYPGMMQSQSLARSTIGKLLSAPLGEVASALRTVLDPAKIRHELPGFAALLAQSPDKSNLSFIASADPALDIMLSSWVKVDCYDADFNFGLGKPINVVRPCFPPVESLVYMMPRSERGIAVGLCLRENEMQKLKSDAQFAQYMEFVG